MLSIQNATSSLGQTITQMLPILYTFLIKQPISFSIGTPL